MRNEILILLSWFSLYVASIYEGDDLTKKLQTINHFKYKPEAEAEYLFIWFVSIFLVGSKLPNNFNTLIVNKSMIFHKIPFSFKVPCTTITVKSDVCIMSYFSVGFDTLPVVFNLEIVFALQ